MTKNELTNLPLAEMVDSVQMQLNLTDRERNVFNLRYRRGLTLQEIADEMCLDIQAVKRLHKKIQGKLAFVKL